MITSASDDLRDRLERREPVREEIDGGTLHIDRPLPFLCVVRADDSDVAELVRGQASYLEVGVRAQVGGVVHRVGETLTDLHGSLLLIEFWAVPDRYAPSPATFRIHATVDDAASDTVRVLREALCDMRLGGRRCEVEVAAADPPTPPGLEPILSRQECRRLGCVVLGLEIPRVWQDDETDDRYPLVLRDLKHGLSSVLQRSFFEFASVETSLTLRDFRALGRREIVEPAWTADRTLARIASSIGFLVAVTPANTDEAWAAFEASGREDEPVFHYRPLSIDPDLVKRRLFDIPLEDIEDPTIAALLGAKRRELDRLVTMLEDRGTSAFAAGSLQLYGGIDDDLVALARDVLDLTADDGRETSKESVDAETLARRALAEIARYPGLGSSVRVRDDLPGVLVSEGDLLIGSRVRIFAERIEALLHHEIGTHAVTYANGDAQPLRIFRSGLPGYEETQEGLAVFAECAVGGLVPSRLRTLAARTLAARTVTDGATFVDTFRVLSDECALSPTAAFTTAMRVHRAGGFLKDAFYLRGFVGVLEYLADGGDLDMLLVGKLPVDAVPVVRELRWRKVLEAPAHRPRWLDHPAAARNLERARAGLSVADVAEDVMR